MAHILIVDDSPGVRDTLAMVFECEQYTVTTAESGMEALHIIERGDPIDCIILDIEMPGIDGLRTLENIKCVRPAIPIIMTSDHGTFEAVVEATKHGAFDFVEKPPDRAKLLVRVKSAIEASQGAKHAQELREGAQSKGAMLGKSTAIESIQTMVERVAPTDARVMITGENGVGKELVARAIHRLSRRSEKPFVEVNCAAIPQDLIESELFGHEKGAFTGAISQHIGKFEQADHGTLFLDEIGDMHLEAQAKMLRVIEEGRLERVGSSSGKPIPVNVRILAATNKNLVEEIRRGRFREDLFHRLNVIPIPVPALRERSEDIPLLVSAFAEEFSAYANRKLVRFDDAALQLLIEYPFPGNIRELRNVVERIVILSNEDIIRVDDVRRLGLAASRTSEGRRTYGRTNMEPELPSYRSVEIGEATKGMLLSPAELLRIDHNSHGLLSPPHERLSSVRHQFDEAMHADTLDSFPEKAECAYIMECLREHGWNISRTADALNIQRSHLHTKIKKYGLVREQSS